MGLAHITPAVSQDWPSPDLPVHGPGPTEFSKTRDLIRACPRFRVARHWSVRCLHVRNPLSGGL